MRFSECPRCWEGRFFPKTTRGRLRTPSFSPDDARSGSGGRPPQPRTLEDGLRRLARRGRQRDRFERRTDAGHRGDAGRLRHPDTAERSVAARPAPAGGRRTRRIVAFCKCVRTAPAGRLARGGRCRSLRLAQRSRIPAGGRTGPGDPAVRGADGLGAPRARDPARRGAPAGAGRRGERLRAATRALRRGTPRRRDPEGARRFRPG